MSTDHNADHNADDDSDDLSEFHGVFFDEADEHLANMESLLLAIAVAAPEAEELNAIFRAAHSIKGGAGMFEFKDIASLTHEMETVFDRVRKGAVPLSTDLVDTFLAAGDMLKAMLAARRAHGDPVAPVDVERLCDRLRVFLEAPGPSVPAATPIPPVAEAAAANHVFATPVFATHVFDIVLRDFEGHVAPEVMTSVIADLAQFGAVETFASTDHESTTRRQLRLTTAQNEQAIVDALGFVFAPAMIDISRRDDVAVPTTKTGRVAKATRKRATKTTKRGTDPAGEPVDAAPDTREDFGLFVDPASLATTAPARTSAVALEVVTAISPPSSSAPEHAPVAQKPSPVKSTTATDDASSIRVGVQKVDQLINLVGELVITQAMLAQTASKSDGALHEALLAGLSQLQRNTRDLQEAAMSIRMLPMSFAFSRFPRMVRDVSVRLSKEVELHLIGETTELDKGLIERIVDPLTHLVRNSLDHGLESPAERIAKGKPARGSITLRAFHQGGAIVIEVSDDGRGLPRDRILAKARERGFAVSDAMSDQEVWQLIFEAGFSTAETVTDVSGRGVGMDVVRRNIEEMGGRVEIDSVLDVGTRMRIKLPLTLAILEGMSVRLGNEMFIVPLGYICESLQPKPGTVTTVGGVRQVIPVRGEYLPVVSLADIFDVPSDSRRPEDGIIVILEAESGKTALLVDGLVGQHQVVIKSLETNYRKVAGISGATIMGDGRVAMILDVPYLVGLSHSRLEKAA